MSVRAAPARTRDPAPAIALPAKAAFKSLASVLEAGFRNLSLHDGAHTDGKVDRDGYLRDNQPVAGPLKVVVGDIRVEDAVNEGTVFTQTINFSVYGRDAVGNKSPGFPLDGPDVPFINYKNLIRSGRLVGTFYKRETGVDPKFDSVVMEFSHEKPFKGIITETGPRNAKVELPRVVPHKALRRAAQWIKGGTKLQDEDEAAFDSEEFLDMSEVAPMFHHLAEMVFNVYTALFDENRLKPEMKKLLLVGLRWPGARWSIGDPMDYDDDGYGQPKEDNSDDSGLEDDSDHEDDNDDGDGSDESYSSEDEDAAPEIDPGDGRGGKIRRTKSAVGAHC